MKKKITILLILLDIILILINVVSIGISYQDNKKYLSSITSSIKTMALIKKKTIMVPFLLTIAVTY